MLRRASGLVFVAFMAAICGCSANRVESKAAKDVALLRVEISGSRSEMEPLITGNLEVSDRQATLASCYNVFDWKDDISLNLDVVVATRDDLVRVAEMLSSGEASPELANVVEKSILSTGSPDYPKSDDQSVSIEPEEWNAYIEDRSKPATEDSLDRFVVYAVLTTRTSWYVTFIDTSTLEKRSLIEEALPMSGSAMDTAVAGRSDTVISECDPDFRTAQA
jgi:hypothetical protein